MATDKRVTIQIGKNKAVVPYNKCFAFSKDEIVTGFHDTRDAALNELSEYVKKNKLSYLDKDYDNVYQIGCYGTYFFICDRFWSDKEDFTTENIYGPMNSPGNNRYSEWQRNWHIHFYLKNWTYNRLSEMEQILSAMEMEQGTDRELDGSDIVIPILRDRVEIWRRNRDAADKRRKAEKKQQREQAKSSRK